MKTRLLSFIALSIATTYASAFECVGSEFPEYQTFAYAPINHNSIFRQTINKEIRTRKIRLLSSASLSHMLLNLLKL